jgi:hypothetical protein
VHEQYRAGANVHVDTAQRSREGRLVIGVRLDRLVHQYRPLYFAPDPAVTVKLE